MKHLLLAAGLAASSTCVAADEYAPVLRDYVKANALSWVQDPAIISAIRSQNIRTATFTQDQIDALDLSWRAEVGLSEQPTIQPVVTNTASEFLRRQVEVSEGVIAEVFVMDRRGLNVAASDTTSDYWQGDEAKFSETFAKGPGAMHVSDVEFDESTQAYVGQVSVSIVDPVSQEVIGAITFGLNANMLF